MVLIPTLIAIFPLAHPIKSEQITVDLSTPIIQKFKGIGIQVDPFSYEPTPAQWARIWKRVDRCKPGYFRLIFQANTYCNGFNADGEPIYSWKSNPIVGDTNQVYKILDYAQKRDVDVMIGEWGCPVWKDTRLEPGDPRWTRLITDWISHLLNDRHYSVIKNYDFFNEPNGNWSGNKDYESWLSGMKSVGESFKAKGLSPRIQLSSPGTSGNSYWMENFTYIKRCAKDIPDLIGSYNLHWYAEDEEVINGKLEPFLSNQRKIVLDTDPKAKDKSFFMGESGIFTGRCNGDQQPRVKTFEYGVLMADYTAQIARAGWEGLSYWDLDDAMHTNDKYIVPPGPNTLKIWGFWNTQGTAMGNPADENLRPPFYSWTVTSRLFPKGSTIVECNNPNLPKFRALAGTDAKRREVSVMLVNDSDDPREVSVDVPDIGTRTLWEYHYFDKDRPVDKEGFPIAAKKRTALLSAGFSVSLPSRGVVFLTTRNLGW